MSFSLGRAGFFLAICAVPLFIGGCLTGGGNGGQGPATPPPANEPPPANDVPNTAPSISGDPPPAVTVGQNYRFAPVASDPDGDTLTFSIQNPPRWASFNSTTGTLSGVATAGHEGTYDNIRITVSDGDDAAATPRFSVAVVQNSLGSIELSWQAPTVNEDGSALVDLGGYKIYYGTESGTYDNSVTIDNPGITTYVVENLTPGTYYLVATSFNSNDVESDYSSEAVKTVN